MLHKQLYKRRILNGFRRGTELISILFNFISSGYEMHTIFMIRYQIYCLSRYFFQNLWINTLYLSLKFSNFDCCLCLEHLLNLTEIWLQVKYRSFKCLLCKQSSFHDFVFKKVINKTLFHIQSNRLKMSRLPFQAYKIKRPLILSKGLY